MSIGDNSCVFVGNQSVPLEIRRRKGTKYLKISLGYQNQIVVSVPWRCSEKVALGFVEKQRAWLEQQLAKAPQPRTIESWLSEHPQVSASGDRFHVQVERTERARADYTFDNSGADLVLRLPQTATEGTLLRLVRSFAKDALHCRVAYQAKRLGFAIPIVSVRDQSSRWGSCSSTGKLSLNWRLILLAPELQDYVILHELAHLTEMNHSKRFWALLDTYDPNRVAHEAELDRIGPELMRVGRFRD